MLTYGSLFSGIEGFGLGFERAGFQCAWRVEKAEEPRRVLRRHWPHTPIFEDVKDVGAKNLTRVDVICLGFPCQDLSVAGERAGLSGNRSGLWFEGHRIIAELKPRWVEIENVPGLLSSNGGRDFATVLRGLVELGYGVCWRILDAQYDGVAQRRRRVFIVGSLGTGSAAEVLFESEGVLWNPPARGEAGQGTSAVAVRRSQTSSNGWGVKSDGTTGTLDGTGGDAVVANALSASMGHHGHSSPRGDGSDNLVADTLNSGGNNGGFRTEPGAHIIPAFQNTGHGWWNESQTAQTVRTPDGGGSMEANLIACNNFGERDVETSLSASNERIDGDTETFVVAFTQNLNNPSGGISPTLRNADAGSGSNTCVAFTERTRVEGRTFEAQEECAYALTNPGSGGRTHSRQIAGGFGVRRLTPRECERLQGFPDDWTRWGDDGREISDSARYRMLGNAVAVPCAEWIARRIVKAEAAMKARRERAA